MSSEIKNVLIFGRDNCPFCEQAVLLAENNKYDYSYKKIGTHITLEEVQELVPVPFRSVPQIFVNDIHVGGFTEFRNFVLELKEKESELSLDDLDL